MVPFSLVVLTAVATYILADVISLRNPLNYAIVAGSSVLFSMLATYFRKGMASGLPSIAVGILLFVLSFWVLKILGYSPQDVAFAVVTGPEDQAHVDPAIPVEGTFGPSACDTRVLAVAVMQLDPARYYCYRMACNGYHKWTSLPLQIGRIDNDYGGNYELSVWSGTEEHISEAVKPSAAGHSSDEMTHQLALHQISGAVHVTRNPKK